MLKGKPARPMKKGRRVVATTGIVETGTEESMINNKGVQRGDPEEDDNGTSTPNSEPPATPANERLAGAPPVTSGPGSAVSPVLPSYPVGRGISLPFGQLLPKCDTCSCNALITWRRDGNPKKHGVVCLDHGLEAYLPARDLALRSWKNEYIFISPEHEAAIRAFLT